MREMAVYVPFLSLIITVLGMYVANKRNNVADVDKRIQEAEKRTERDTAIQGSLNTIQSTVVDIKNDQQNIQKSVEEINTRLVIVEQSTKSAHRRIDRMEGKDEGRHD